MELKLMMMSYHSFQNNQKHQTWYGFGPKTFHCGYERIPAKTWTLKLYEGGALKGINLKSPINDWFNGFRSVSCVNFLIFKNFLILFYSTAFKLVFAVTEAFIKKAFLH